MKKGAKRRLLLRIDGLGGEAAEARKLRVHVTLHGFAAAVVDELAELSGRPRARVVRELVAEAVARRTAYEDIG